MNGPGIFALAIFFAAVLIALAMGVAVLVVVIVRRRRRDPSAKIIGLSICAVLGALVALFLLAAAIGILAGGVSAGGSVR